MTKKTTKKTAPKATNNTAPSKPEPAPVKTDAPEPNADPSVNGLALFNFLVKQAGGEDAAIKAFAGERFQGMSKGMTLGDALAMADSEGWGDLFRGMTLGSLRGTSGAPKKTGTKRPRGKSEETRKAIMKALSESKGPLSAREVSEAVKGDPRPVARSLAYLVTSGAVIRTGSKRDSRYSLA